MKELDLIDLLDQQSADFAFVATYEFDPAFFERRLLRRGEFASVQDLADRIIAFIKDYNKRAAPFRWTYDGRPLQVA